MKIIKVFFELTKKGVICRVTHCAHCGNEFFGIKPNIFIFAYAAILIPCLLQSPLVAFGQDGPDFVNSGLVINKVSGESIKAVNFVSGGSNTRGKSTLVLNNCISENGMFTTFIGENMPEPLECNSKNGSQNKTIKPLISWLETMYPFYKDPVTSWEYWLMTFVILYWPVFGGSDREA